VGRGHAGTAILGTSGEQKTKTWDGPLTRRDREIQRKVTITKNLIRVCLKRKKFNTGGDIKTQKPHHMVSSLHQKGPQRG